MSEIGKKINLSPEFYTALVVVLVGVAGFGLGRLSAIEDSKERVEILLPAQDAESQRTGNPSVAPSASGRTTTPQDGLLVASRNSTKYHFPWCSGAQRIAEKNKIWFNSIEEARAAGYEPAANCKGLE